MRRTPGSLLLRLPVRLHGIEVGRPVDVVLDAELRRGLGLELVCGDGARRFLPLRAATIAEDEITIASAFALLDDDQLRFYRSRGRTLSDARGEAVQSGGITVGTLEDVVLDEGHAIVELEVGTGSERRRVSAAPAP